MKKGYLLKILPIVLCAFVLMCINAKAFGTDLTPGEMARNVEENQSNNQDNNSNESMPIEETSDGEEEDDTYYGDLYLINDDSEYVIDKVIDGNVFIIGNNIKITGEINGSLFALAKDTIEIAENAYVLHSAYLCADNIVMNGNAYDMYCASNKFQMSEKALVYRDLKTFADKASLAGNIGRNVDICAQTITIPNDANKLIIFGNLNYTANNEILNLNKEVSVKKEVNFTKYEKNENDGKTTGDYVINAIATIAFDVVLYTLFIFLAPKFIQKTKDYVSTKGLIAFAIGLGFTVLVPVLSLILMLTGIGVGIAFLLLFAYCAVLMLNACVVSITANEFIANKMNLSNNRAKKILMIIPVSLVIWLLRKIPILGSWVSIIVFLCGVGIVVFYQFTKNRE